MDPLINSFPWNTPYAFSENRVIDAIELEGLEAFTVHGTASNPATFNKMTDRDIKQLSGNRTVNRDFSWESDKGFNNSFFNDQSDRHEAAQALSKHVISNMKSGEDITIIGHSHGGNVALQAVKLIKGQLEEGDNRKINVISIATPAYNGAFDLENPANSGMDSHTHFYSENDVIQTFGANLFGSKDASRTYKSPLTKNFKVNDTKKMSFPDAMNPGMKQKVDVPLNNPVESHSIHRNNPELLKKNE